MPLRIIMTREVVQIFRMKFLGMFLFLSVFFTNISAEPFNISLPLRTQFDFSAMEWGQWNWVVDMSGVSKKFQLQVPPVTAQEQYLPGLGKENLALGLNLGFGLGHGFELVLGTTGDASHTAIKYMFGAPDSSWKNMLVFNLAHAIDFGHGGAVIDDGSCDFFDIGCMISSMFNIFFGGPPKTYEYDYEADIEGAAFGYLQGYQYTEKSMAYWGVLHSRYSIRYTVTDNTGGGADFSDTTNTDLTALMLGMKWTVKPEKKLPRSLLLNYTALIDSSTHKGADGGALMFSYVVPFE